jgi:hypothetical protein
MARKVFHWGVVTDVPEIWFCPRREQRAGWEGFAIPEPGSQASGKRGAENTFRVVDTQPGVPRHATVHQEEQIPSSSCTQSSQIIRYQSTQALFTSINCTQAYHFESEPSSRSTNRSQCSITSSETIATSSASHTLSTGCDTHRDYF